MTKLVKGGAGTDTEFAGARLRGLSFKPLRRTLASKDVSDSAKNAFKQAFIDGSEIAQKRTVFEKRMGITSVTTCNL